MDQQIEIIYRIATFAAVFVALFAAHSFGDHWVQTGKQACGKGERTAMGRKLCLQHVAWLAVTKLVFLLVLQLVTGLRLATLAVVIGLVIDGASHYWADRRFTLEGLSDRLGKLDFYNLGKDTVHQFSPSGSHMGTGAYVLDQSFHIAWLFIAALIISI